jgi:hypothetical protein
MEEEEARLRQRFAEFNTHEARRDATLDSLRSRVAEFEAMCAALARAAAPPRSTVPPVLSVAAVVCGACCANEHRSAEELAAHAQKMRAKAVVEQAKKAAEDDEKESLRARYAEYEGSRPRGSWSQVTTDSCS